MAYSTDHPPWLWLQGFTSNVIPQVWGYTSGDTDGTVSGAGYISNGQRLGMKKGDLVISFKTGITTATYLHIVASLSSSDDSVTLSSTSVPDAH
jgi:hypothetical protein